MTYKDQMSKTTHYMMIKLFFLRNNKNVSKPI